MQSSLYWGPKLHGALSPHVLKRWMKKKIKLIELRYDLSHFSMLHRHVEGNFKFNLVTKETKSLNYVNTCYLSSRVCHNHLWNYKLKLMLFITTKERHSKLKMIISIERHIILKIMPTRAITQIWRCSFLLGQYIKSGAKHSI